jgi:hypothetical protein
VRRREERGEGRRIRSLDLSIHANMAASLFKLWLTPSLSISILVESERTQAPLVRLASQLATLSRFVLGRPSLLREALEDEVLRSPLVDLDTISSTTLRRVDHAYFLAREVGPPPWICL